MLEEICEKLNLNSEAGLGWRLSQINIVPDHNHPGLLYLHSDDEVETAMLVMALTSLTERQHQENLRFRY